MARCYYLILNSGITDTLATAVTNTAANYAESNLTPTTHR